MKRRMIIGVTVFALLMTGCQTKPEQEIEAGNLTEAQEANQEVTSEANLEPEETEEVTQDQSVEKEALLSLLNEGRMVEYKAVLPNYINSLNQSDIDELFIAHLNYLQAHLLDEIDLYYSDETQGIHQEILEALDESSDDLVFGDEKLKLVDKIKIEAYKALIQKTLESNYALSSAEGTYYPQLDYIEIQSMYQERLSEQYNQYLRIMTEAFKQPLTSEAYLAVDLSTLKARMYVYEDFLQNYGKEMKKNQPEMFENIRMMFSSCIWNTVNPNLFNGLLGIDLYPTKELVDFYHSIVSDDQYPITTEAATRILRIIEEERETVFGSQEKLELLYPMSQDIANDLYQKLEMTY